MQMPVRQPRNSRKEENLFVREPPLPPTQLIKTPGRASYKSDTLSELVNKRPPACRKENLKAFDKLFIKHAKVQKLDAHLNPLDLESLKQGWTALRNEEKGLYIPVKMDNAIKHHLKNVHGMDDDVVQAVTTHWRDDINLRKVRRYRRKLSTSTNPDLIKKEEARKEVQRRNRKKRYADTVKGDIPWPFEDYMAKYGINGHGLTAKKVEVETRVFRHEYRNQSLAATAALRKFLEEKRYDPYDVEMAVGARRGFLKDLKRGRHDQGKRLESASEEASSKSGSNSTQAPMSDRGKKIQEKLVADTRWTSTSNL